MSIREFWRKKGLLNFLLWPFSYLFYLVQSLRRQWYKIFLPQSFSAPIIVVGNLSVGGAGKSPVVMYCVELLRTHGLKPGIVSRGYGGKSTVYPLVVDSKSSPALCGDEPVMMAKRLGCPIVVDPNRVRAVQTLLAQTNCNVVISDDGLQHYALHRDLEIVVIDLEEGLGNAWCLPAGPLREPPSRLRSVNFILGQETERDQKTYALKRMIHHWVNVKDPRAIMPPSAFDGIMVHAIAGIAKPEAFFESCRSLGMRLEKHVYPDHASYNKEHVSFADGFPVVMTEKDAVKCVQYVCDNTWYAVLKLEIDPLFDKQLLSAVQNLCNISSSQTA